MKHISFLFSFLFLLAASVGGQTNNGAVEFENQSLSDERFSTDEYKNEIVKYDLSKLWLASRNANVLGFIGDDFQRLRMKIISITKDKNKPDTYIVTGKSMVKNNINRFGGTITVSKVRAFKKGSWGVDDDYAGQNIKNLGKIIAKYNFAEDKTQPGSGVFEGVLATDWLVKNDSKIYLDDVLSGGDGYTNNQFVGTWKSYKTGAVKTANWGDDRIPMSGDLDIGAGEFAPDEKYRKFGWQNYYDAYFNGNAKAFREEQRQWWK